MKVYHIEFAKSGTGISGGEMWMVELIKYLIKRKVKNILLTTDNGKEAYERLGLVEGKYLSYKTINSYRLETKTHIFISYLVRTFQAITCTKKQQIRPTDVIICHSEFFPNSIPFRLVSGKSPHTFAMFHMLAPDIFKGYKGHFANRLQWPSPTIVHFKLNQWLYLRMMRQATTIITNNGYYRKILSKKCPRNDIYVLRRYAGAEKIVRKKSKMYDLLWMGRFHPQKGLLEVPKVIQAIKKHRPNIRVAVLGGGNERMLLRFQKEIDDLKLNQNIAYKGFVTGSEKYDYIAKSKIFLMTSSYESFGIVSLEALKNGVPVVAYDLPVYSVFTKGMLKIPLAHRDKMAKAVLGLLSNKNLYQKTSLEAQSFAENFNWSNTANEVFKLMEQHG